MARIVGADRANLGLRALPGQLRHAIRHHGTVVLTMAAAANRKCGVRILRQGQCWSDGRKTNGREQDEAEEAREHEQTGSVYAFVA
jgi:hypothetical protein